MKKVKYAPWDKWNPRKYLDTYFSTMRRDEDLTLKFLITSFKKIPLKKKVKILEFGAGPTVVHVLVAVPYASEIHIADYLRDNLDEIRKWLKHQRSHFNWDSFTKRILEIEGQKPTSQNIKMRNHDLRKKVKRLFLSDASLDFPLRDTVQKYPLVIMTYCVDSATSSKDIWRGYMKNVFKLLTPNGTILVAALRRCRFYNVGKYYFPSANINEDDFLSVFLEVGFKKKNVIIQVKEVPECSKEGYNSLMFARATKEAK